MEETFDGMHVPQLERFLFCGEELPKKPLTHCWNVFQNAKIYNTYGPTEATVAVSGVQITEELLEQYDRVPIGYVKEDSTVFFYGRRSTSS